MLNITIVGQREVFAQLDAMPAVVRRILGTKLLELGQQLKTHIQQDKLSGQVLKVVTGALRRSITVSPLTEIGEALMVEVFSAGDVKYAGIHEFGGKTAPHDIYPKDPNGVLAFMIGGEQIFAKVVHHPGSNMPERSFMRSSLRDMAPSIAEKIQAAIVTGLEEARA